MLRSEGVEALQQRLRRDLDNARWLAEQIEAAPHWQLLAPVQLQTLCIRHCPPGLEGRRWMPIPGPGRIGSMAPAMPT